VSDLGTILRVAGLYEKMGFRQTNEMRLML
jgi:hypothetical protein